jgi:penicillin amidase
MKKWHLIALTAALSLALAACGGDDKKKTEDTTPQADVTADVPVEDLVAPDQQEQDVPPAELVEETAGEVVEEPLFCLDEQVEGESAFQLEGLDGPIEIVLDKWGVPHVFATTEHDMFYGEGFIVARYRFIQMHAMRKISSGLFSNSAAATAGDLSNDLYMRIVNLLGAAEGAWEEIQANDPEVKAMLEAFSGGVNAYIAQVEAGTVPKPLEWPLVGEITPWVPTDSLVVARLQSWDLSFGGRTDKVENAMRVSEILQKWGDSPLEGLLVDLHPMAPITDTVVVPQDNGRREVTYDGMRAMRHPWYQRVKADYWQKVGKTLAAAPLHPRNRGDDGVGSNNWTVSGNLSDHGFAMVANDTHLSLRNPSVFFEIHLNTTRAGGEIDGAGVTFPGIPGVILGRNAHAAWGATVYYADVTDVYIETLTLGDTPTVEFNGAQVPIEVRTETFPYKVLEAETCESWITDFIAGTDYTVEEKDGKCLLTVNIWIVPHHGPIIPGSMEPIGSEKAVALSWKWTGFEPSHEVRTAYEFLLMKTPEEFKAAMDHFEVGAMNWVYGDVDNHIAYSAHCRIPVRKHIADGLASDFPAFLPYPGDGCCEWEGDVPDELLPQDLDPEAGYISTANGDALGHTLDGDPYNDDSYQGYLYYPGFRAARVQELMEEKAAAGKLTLADMQAIQGDHRSPLGALLTSHILDAVTAAEAAKAGDAGSDPMLAPFADDDRILAARDRLEAWSFEAEAGALPDATEQEKADSIATSIFNAWAVHVSKRILGNKVETPYDMQWHSRFLVNLLTNPGAMVTYDAEAEDSILWDDTTTEEVETRHYIVLQGLVDALDFLQNPDVVGVAQMGGFGTPDMDQWNWGKLHTVTMGHALGGKFNIPSAEEFPDGYPRPGDNFVVDAADAGWSDTKFTFGSGPSIRNVYTLDPDGPKADTVIPGGQDAAVLKKHYKDQFDLWVKNETHPLHGDVESIITDSETCFVLEP